MKKRSYFLDANILVSAIAFDGNERRLLEFGTSRHAVAMTSEYVLREVGEALTSLGYSLPSVVESILWIRNFVRIDDPSNEQIEKHWDALRDKSDVPVLAAAIEFRCVLITGDKELRKKAARYVDVMTTTEALEEFPDSC